MTQILDNVTQQQMGLHERVWYGRKASDSAIENLRTIRTEN